MRISNKRTAGQKSGENHLAGQAHKRACKRETARQHRRNEQRWAREVRKAHNSAEDLPPEPPPTIGGFYIT